MRHGRAIGILQCDDFLDRMEQCVLTKVEGERRKFYERSMPQFRETWRRAAGSPEGRKALTETCTKAAAFYQKALASYNCQW